MSFKRSVAQRQLQSDYAAQTQPLGIAELMQLRLAVAEFAPDWDVELCGVCHDDSSLVLLPEDADDENGSSFVITREAYGFRLDQFHWDALTEVGVYRSMIEVVAMLRLRLAFCDTLAAPSSFALH